MKVAYFHLLYEICGVFSRGVSGGYLGNFSARHAGGYEEQFGVLYETSLDGLPGATSLSQPETQLNLR